MASTKPKQGTDLLYSLMAQARQYPDTIVMGRGDPDFDTPPAIIEAAQAAMRQHGNDYTPAEGILPLRQAIAERVKRVNGIDVDPETEVVITQGGQEALFLMVISTIFPGDGMIVPEPNYNTYNDALAFAGGVKIPVPTYPQEGFRVDPARVEAALTDTSKVLLLVSPNNPSASVIAPDDERALVKLAEARDLVILADDIYDLFVYDDYQHLSPASLPGGKERTLTLNALSKSFAMTGWRLGWIVGPADLMQQVRQMKAAISGGTSVITQYAALAAMTGPQDAVYAMRDTYARRRRIVLDALDEMGIHYGMPQGGQFVFCDITPTGLTSTELCQRVLDEVHVLVYPGASFAKGTENYVRITFLQPEDKLYEGLERMKKVMERVMADKVKA